MIIEVAEAIMQQFNATPLLKDALSGHLYYEQAPQDMSGDYGVFYILGGTQDELMGDADDNIKNLEVQFNLFSDAADGGYRIAGLRGFLMDCYDWVILAVDGYNPIKMQPLSWLSIPVTDNIRQITVNYEVSVQKD